ncbi:ABC transporter substrate-binding protein [Roseomonas sp. 18066]|uniref:ABC transporter substrate-binding protein n=1 Tax=Roseomonas sp. 18066 TaxID=2681412 RepID=UPI0013583B15|nr:extracellular solute-binding protein [Roseomonas sp. 18066]
MRMINRRHFVALAAGGALLAQQKAQAQALPAHEQALYDAAKKEGEITWYTGQMQAEPSEAIGRAFGERYPGVKVNVVRSASQVAFQRLAQDMRARVNQCDVFSSTDYSHAAHLKRGEQLMAYRPENAKGLIEVAQKAADPDGFFQITYLGLYLMARHSKNVSEADAPKSWRDLTDPRWKDRIAVGHPGYSGAITAWCLMMQEKFGVGYFKELERNRPLIGRSSGDPVTTLNAGERMIGAAIPSATTLLSISRGNPVTLIYPTDGTLVVPSPTGAMRAAPHPNAAKLFMEFVTSPAYHTATRAYFGESLRPEVPPPPGARALDSIPLYTPKPEDVEAKAQEVKDLWRDTFGI